MIRPVRQCNVSPQDVSHGRAAADASVRRADTITGDRLFQHEGIKHDLNAQAHRQDRRSRVRRVKQVRSVRSGNNGCIIAVCSRTT
jgi:hypothetical protein